MVLRGLPNTYAAMDDQTEHVVDRPAYKWPWYLAAAVLLGIALSVFAIHKEATRIHQQKQYSLPEPSK